MKTEGGFLISQIKRISDRTFAQKLKECGVEEFNGAQGKILYVLWNEENLPISKIARRTSLAKTTLTSMIDRMEQKGLLTRANSADDRREILIGLTPKARALKDVYLMVSDYMTDIYYHGFSDEEITAFERSLKKLLKNLEKEGA